MRKWFIAIKALILLCPMSVYAQTDSESPESFFTTDYVVINEFGEIDKMREITLRCVNKNEISVDCRIFYNIWKRKNISPSKQHDEYFCDVLFYGGRESYEFSPKQGAWVSINNSYAQPCKLKTPNRLEYNEGWKFIAGVSGEDADKWSQLPQRCAPFLDKGTKKYIDKAKGELFDFECKDGELVSEDYIDDKNE